MNEKFFNRKLIPSTIALAYAYVGGLFFFFSITLAFVLSDPNTLMWVAIFIFLLFVLVTAVLLYFLLRSNEKAITLAQKNLERVSRALKTRSGCNQAMLRVADELKLMQETCRVIVEEGGYVLAWVGLAEADEAQTVRPVAQWGKDHGFLATEKISWGDNERGQGPVATAIRTRLTSHAQHNRSWLDMVQDRGYASSIALPLLDGAHCFGALAIYAGEKDAFDKDEVELLRAMAEDLAYGVVTLRLRREQEEGRQARRQLATIIEQGTEGVLTFDAEGVIRYVNPAFEEISGCDNERLVNKNIGDLRLAGRNRTLFQMMQEVRADGAARVEQLINYRPDGSQYEIIARVTPVFDAQGRITSFAAVVRDISNEVQLERQLRQAQKMQIIATLSGGIAHDFNNILASIITCSEMALDDLPLDSPWRRNIEVIHRAGQRGRELVRQIRTLSRQNEQEKKPVSLEPILDECLKLLRPSLPASIEIHDWVMPGLGQILADSTQMHQVIVNLCTNAAQAMERKGGVLDVGLDNIELSSEALRVLPDLKPGPYLRLTVRDTGEGMTPAVMERIFDPFFTTREQGAGTGLGLSVVHGIVKNHGGAIEVSSTPGKGSIFRVYLPRIPGTGEQAQAEPPLSIASGHERILFVDDEQDIVYAGETMLRRLGYEVTATRCPLEALEIFRRNPQRFDLVITDLTMPRMSGAQLAQEIARERRSIPIILCTGFAGRLDELRRADEEHPARICEVVLKPFDRTDLAQAIRRALAEGAAQIGGQTG
ncbi:hybrid sensor histidine kinase/response regulator [Geoalkalibacter sp.]|uniref:hybrid sensor histidine kinase/response regulator n=1 Tax=Geoalkalibacter sp. TaxID=3041440 RepID=UPI00272E0F32|nr:ATP-binding protein [Geoalkalibacter sp.]